MENFNYDCIGNEAVLNDCPKNNKRCPSSTNLLTGRSLLVKVRRNYFNHVLNYEKQRYYSILPICLNFVR